MTISVTTLEMLRGELQQLPAKEKAALTARDAVAVLADEIRSARDQGYSLADLSEMLTARGLKLSASTLGTYLRALRIETDASRARRGRAPRTES